MLSLLRTLTQGRFKDGAIARIFLREYWSTGVAPSFAEYAAAWLQAVEDHRSPDPEWAFLADRAQGKETSDTKTLRANKRAATLKLLDKILDQPHRT